MDCCKQQTTHKPARSYHIYQLLNSMLGYKALTPKTNISRSKWGAESEQLATQVHLSKAYSGKRLPDNSLLEFRDTRSRREHTKKTINEVIDEMNGKRFMNSEALEMIHLVNSQVVERLRNQSPYPTSNSQHFNQKPLQTTHLSESPYTYDKNYQQSNFSLAEENIQLRTLLNEEIKKNNELLSTIANVKQENSELRQSQVAPVHLIRENQQLKQELSQSRLQNQQLPSMFLEELENLKRENQILRSHTVSLLKKEKLI